MRPLPGQEIENRIKRAWVRFGELPPLPAPDSVALFPGPSLCRGVDLNMPLGVPVPRKSPILAAI